MRLVFDSAPFRYDPTSGRGPSGVAKWSLGALSALARQEPAWELIGVAPGFDYPTVPALDIGPTVVYRRAFMPRRVHHLLEIAGLEPRVEAWTGRIDAVLGNAFITARSRRAASIPVFYDLSLVKHPELHPAQRRAYVSTQLNRVIKHSAVVVTISESVRAEIADHYGLPEERIFVAPPSWQPVQFPYDATFEAPDLPRDYFLFVGTIEPRKNILGLLTALERLRSRRSGVPVLVLVGGNGWGLDVFGDKLDAAIADGAVIRPGYVPDSYMESLYRGALALVYPSLYEGFGMPILEAMAAGCPVLTSNVPSTAETAGQAALLVDPSEYEQIEHGIERLIDDSSLRADLVERGLRRAEQFSWERTGKQLGDAIAAAVAESR